jgi:transcriptional regulator with XRE-family HTH domain
MRDHDIRRDLASGMTQKDVAVRYGVTQERISQIFQRDRDKIVDDIASKGHAD